MKTTFWQLLDIYKIEIPIMQRDYAQGRDNNKKIEQIRQGFLLSIKKALDNDRPLNLDFIYGSTENNALVLLDGQQRLTTLFLLYWFLAIKEKRFNEDVKKKLHKFSYHTRISSTRFFEKLVDFNLDLECNIGKISDIIKNQPWFFVTWKNDPTIKSMLTMLDSIQENFNMDSNNYFEKLTNSESIYFEFLNLERFNLTDSLYIKMNARGKPITDFENFKAVFEKYLLEKHPQRKDFFSKNIDGKWTEMFWRESKGNVDESFMNYFDYITEICYYLDAELESKIPENDLDLKKIIFSDGNNLSLLIDSLDKWSNIKNTTSYFDEYFTSNTYEVGKVKLYENDLNLFEKCITKNKFNAKEKLLLYGFILQLLIGEDKRQELRLLRNLIINSPFELRAENFHEIYTVIRNLFYYGVDYDKLKPFNGIQIADEERKAKFLQSHQEYRDELNHFEDHYLLMGRMSAIELDSSTLLDSRRYFEKLFKENDPKTISRAMLCMNDEGYSYKISGNRWLYANNNDTWHEIFTSSDVSRVKCSLKKLLEAYKENKDLECIISEYISNKSNEEKRFNYYLVNYPSMQHNGVDKNNGIYVINDNNGFDVFMLNKTRLSGYWRDPYLYTIYYLLGDHKIKMERKIDGIWNMGYHKFPLSINNVEISCCESGWGIVLKSECIEYQERYDNLCKKHKIDEGVMIVELIDDRIAKIMPLIDEIVQLEF